jgi:DTW domain-containing protein YfiP
MSVPESFVPRATCARCRRPESVCYCAHLTSLETTTRIVLLQHPRERDVAIGTARMASLCLPNAELHVGVKWHDSPALARALSDPARPAALLYPGDGAIDVVASPPAGPVTLIVVDGTWWQTKKVVRENPELARLPRFAFTPPAPSEYRIRKEPQDDYVSTIEALVHVLGALEGDPERFHALLLPFRAMIDAQIDCEARLQGGRARKRHDKSGWKRRGPRMPEALRDRARDVVCVVGEANAWPYRCPERATWHEDELVHWAAHRLDTGEAFEAVVRPRHPLAPRTVTHVELSAAALAGGESREEALARWRAFVRDSDVVCAWGHYATALFAETGGYFPAARLDLRHVARVYAKGKVGTLEDFVARIAPAAEESGGGAARPLAAGRAGRRLAQITGIARHFIATARAQSQDSDDAASP